MNNTEAYQDLEWILSESERGFFLLIASARMQTELISKYRDAHIRVFDYMEQPKKENIGIIVPWIQEIQDGIFRRRACAYFILNMQIPLGKFQNFSQLNLLRDILNRLQTNIVFCMTPLAAEQLNLSAMDFYSYIKMSLYFEDEVKDNGTLAVQTPLLVDKSGSIEPPKLDLQGDCAYWLSRAMAFSTQAYDLQEKGHYRDAFTLFDAVRTLREKYLGKAHLDTASAYHNLASVYTEMGAYSKALEFYEKAAEIQESKNSPDIAASYSGIAIVHQRLGNYEKALEYYDKALLIRESKLGHVHPVTATTYTGIAFVYECMAEYLEALKYYKTALAIYNAVYTYGHANIAMVYSNIANVYCAMGNFGKTLESFHNAMKANDSIPNRDDLNTAVTYSNIANVYRAMYDYNEALEFFERALIIQENKIGKNHLNTALTYNDIAITYIAIGDFGKALLYYKKALKIYEETLGEYHPRTVSTYKHIAITYETMYNLSKKTEKFDLLYSDLYNKEAQDLYSKALKIGKQMVNENAADMENTEEALKILESMDSLDDTRVDYNNSRDIVNKIRENCDPIFVESLGDTGADNNSRDIVNENQEDCEPKLAPAIPADELILFNMNYIDLAFNFWSRGELRIAESFFQRAVALLHNDRNDHPVVAATAYHYMAKLYQEMDNSDKAEDCFRKALTIYEQRLGSNHPRSQETRAALEKLVAQRT